MPGQFLSKADRKSLGRFPPSVDPDDLAACFFLNEDDDQAIISRRYRGGGRIAAGLQIGAIRLLGFVPADLSSAPSEVVRFVADQVGATPDDLKAYPGRRRTFSRHALAVEIHLGFCRCKPSDIEALERWLVDRALEHDRPVTLFRMASDHLKARQLVRPGVTVLERLVTHARKRAVDATWRRLEPHVDHALQNRLDGLLAVDPSLEMTPLVWLRQQATAAMALMIRTQLTKLDRLWTLGVEPSIVRELSPNRVRYLARLGGRMTPQALRRTEPEHRYQILIATAVETIYSLTDEILELFDTALGSVDRRARSQRDQIKRSTAKEANKAVRLFGRVGRLILDANIPDADLRAHIFEVMGPVPLTEAIEHAERVARPADDNYIDLLRTRYSQVRKYAPQVLATFDFRAADPDDSLVDAIRLLKELNERGARLVPPDAPVDFSPARWKRCLTDSDGGIDRKTWELCTLFQTRGALRGANLWVGHSRRHQDPKNYLLPDDTWMDLRPRAEAETGIALDGRQQLADLDRQLTANLEKLDATLQDARGVRIENDRLVISPLVADRDPALAHARDKIVALIPDIDLVDILVEVNSWCGFLDSFTHVGHATERTQDHISKLLAVLVANGCNIGVARMARCAGFSPDQLSWCQSWYVRDESLSAANTALVNYQHNHPLAEVWGGGTLSSSDGQRFPFTVRNPTARALRRYYTGKGATIYTWTSDQHSQYGARVIPTTVREATFVLDAIFDNETDLDIEEHTTDTAGYTDLVFGLFDLTGLRFSPRIRGLAGQRLWRLATTPTEGPASSLLRHRIRADRFLDRWDDLLRVAATIRSGHTPASLLISRLQASARQNALTQGLQEYGRIIKTISSLRYLHSPVHRRQVLDQLNKGESIHALRRQLFFANLGRLNRRRPDDQYLQAQCLTLVTNAIICWNTIYLGAALEHLEGLGKVVPREAVIQRLSPTIYEHINLYGRYDFSNLVAPPSGELRPLQVE